MTRGFAILLLLATQAWAHDHARPDLNAWFRSLRSPVGGWCCSGDDVSRGASAWDMARGRYRVEIDGKWYDVPDGTTVEGPNWAGHALVWFYLKDGVPQIRCFMPGTGG